MPILVNLALHEVTLLSPAVLKLARTLCFCGWIAPQHSPAPGDTLNLWHLRNQVRKPTPLPVTLPLRWRWPSVPARAQPAIREGTQMSRHIRNLHHRPVSLWSSRNAVSCPFHTPRTQQPYSLCGSHTEPLIFSPRNPQGNGTL